MRKQKDKMIAIKISKTINIIHTPFYNNNITNNAKIVSIIIYFRYTYNVR